MKKKKKRNRKIMDLNFTFETNNSIVRIVVFKV